MTDFFIDARTPSFGEFTTLCTLSSFVPPHILIDELVVILSYDLLALKVTLLNLHRVVHQVTDERDRYYLAWRIVSYLNRLARETRDNSFVLHAFSKVEQLPKPLRYLPLEGIKEILATSEKRREIFFDEIRYQMGWETFVNKLLDRIGGVEDFITDLLDEVE